MTMKSSATAANDANVPMVVVDAVCIPDGLSTTTTATPPSNLVPSGGTVTSNKTTASEWVSLDIPPLVSSGIRFAGSPPRVVPDSGSSGSSAMSMQCASSSVPSSRTVPLSSSSSSPTHKAFVEGWYVASVAVANDSVLTNIRDCQEIYHFLSSHHHLARRITLTATAPLINTQLGLLYHITLPVNVPLQCQWEGFPPHVAFVANQSPLLGKLRVGQTLDTLRIPGLSDLTLQSGGFTAFRVTDLLQQTSHIHGRILIVKDRSDVLVTEPKGSSNAAFDWGGCQIQ